MTRSPTRTIRRCCATSLGSIFSAAATLISAIEAFKQSPAGSATFKAQLQSLVKTQLAKALFRLIGYFKAGVAGNLIADTLPMPAVSALGQGSVSFSALLTKNLTGDWTDNVPWDDYVNNIAADPSVFGPSGTPFAQINHCARHTVFNTCLNQLLRARATIAAEAKVFLSTALTGQMAHAPHYGLFLAVSRLFDLVRAEGNHITQRHLDFYYRRVLGLAERPSRPGRVHLVAELGKQSPTHSVETGTFFKAGKDARGKDASFAATGETVLNQTKIVSLRSLYRHRGEKVDNSLNYEGRLFASPVANSADGQGTPLTGPDASWHPFFNKTYVGSELVSINMPEASLGFAIASHHLMMAEGERNVTIDFTVTGYTGPAVGTDFGSDLRCLLSTEDGWHESRDFTFTLFQPDVFQLSLNLDGAAPSIRPATPAVHGEALGINLPVLKIELRNDASRPSLYDTLKSVVVQSFRLSVIAIGLKTLAVSNDFGPVDTSKPFLPWGANPLAKSSLTIGCKEAFQKPLTVLAVSIDWQVPPPATQPKVDYSFLKAGIWQPGPKGIAAGSAIFPVFEQIAQTTLNQPDFGPDELHGTTSRNGFFRLQLDADVGQAAYREALKVFLSTHPPTGTPPTPPPIPMAANLSLAYIAEQLTTLNASDRQLFEARSARFLHLTPFGAAEQHPALPGTSAASLLPQFTTVRDGLQQENSAEFYIGLSGLVPPQDMSFLFQVADGTANPLAAKPVPHLAWSYLAENTWHSFEATAVQDGTTELLSAGLVRLSIPDTARANNTLLPKGIYWIRLSVHEKPDAVCNLRTIAAQALEAVFENRGNAPDYAAEPDLPPGTISKLAKPVAAVKSISQPFASFEGRRRESPMAFYTRVSERLRHKDRAISLWDHEHLVLGAFPEIYKVKCLNHTRFEPTESGDGVYDELAAGHITFVTVPWVGAGSQRDPLKPYTSLGLLQDIKTYLARRSSCFATLHVRNPQFEEVRLSLRVRLRPGYDESYHTLQLQNAITRFLSPWAFGEGNPSFDGKVYKSVLINFLEDQPSVDYISDVSMFLDLPKAPGTKDLDAVEGSRAVSILVSAPAHRHQISIIKTAPEATILERCGCST